MREFRKKIKLDSLSMLDGRWGTAIGIFLLTVGVQFLFIALDRLLTAVSQSNIFTTISSVVLPNISFPVPVILVQPSAFFITLAVMLLSLLIATPLRCGVKYWYYRLTYQREPKFSGIFYYFTTAKLYFKALGLKILVSVRVLLFGALLTLPGALLLYFVFIMRQINMTQTQRVLITIGNLSGIVILFFGILITVIFSLRYSLAEYLLALTPDRSIRDIIKDSIRYTNAQKVDLFIFILSYLWWFLSCIVLLPALFVGPYFLSGWTLCARYLIERGAKYDNTPDQMTEFQNPF